MFSAAKRYGFWLMAGSLILLPMTILGQDLGSTTGLFRASNPVTKKNKTTPAEKKTSPKPPVKKAEPKTAPARSTGRNNSRKTVSRPKTTVARETPGKTKSSAKTQPVARAALYASPQKDVVIKVGNPTGGNFEELFEQAIDEGNAARDGRNYTGAESAYRRAQNLKSGDSRAIYGLGNIYSDQQRWEEAETAYRQAISLEPDSAEAHIALSFVLTQPVLNGILSERYSEAESTARRAIQLAPNNAIAYDQLGVALELRGEIGADTQKAYRRAIQIDPSFALAYAHLGRLLRRLGKADESVAAYKDAIRLSTDVPTMILVAEVMQSQQRFAESEQLLRRALSQDPKNPTALFFLGRALTTSGNFDEAEMLLKTSVEVSPTSFVSYALLSSLYSRRGFYDRAEQTLLRALNVVSPNEKKRLAAEFETIGDGLMRLGRKAEAARLYRQAISLDKEKSDLTVKLDKAVKS
jgi:tetratricopeptide (TPR) repeat protein